MRFLPRTANLHYMSFLLSFLSNLFNQGIYLACPRNHDCILMILPLQKGSRGLKYASKPKHKIFNMNNQKQRMFFFHIGCPERKAILLVAQRALLLSPLTQKKYHYWLLVGNSRGTNPYWTPKHVLQIQYQRSDLPSEGKYLQIFIQLILEMYRNKNIYDTVSCSNAQHFDLYWEHNSLKLKANHDLNLVLNFYWLFGRKNIFPAAST